MTEDARSVHVVELVELAPEAIHALAKGDLDAANRAARSR